MGKNKLRHYEKCQQEIVVDLKDLFHPCSLKIRDVNDFVCICLS